nr:hypothetical protein [Paenibacillus sp. sptzw28]
MEDFNSYRIEVGVASLQVVADFMSLEFLCRQKSGNTAGSHAGYAIISLIFRMLPDLQAYDASKLIGIAQFLRFLASELNNPRLGFRGHLRRSSGSLFFFKRCFGSVLQCLFNATIDFRNGGVQDFRDFRNAQALSVMAVQVPRVDILSFALD